MTESTQGFIEEFASTGNFNLLPSILIGLQAEDNVSEVIGVNNCFKMLRNAAAHEPNIIVEAFEKVYNTGSRKLVFIPNTLVVKDNISFDIVDFIYWMHCMFVATEDVAYIRLIRALCGRLYPKYMRRFTSDKRFYCYGSEGLPSLSDYLRLQDELWDAFGIPKHINVADKYLSSKKDELPQLFWRVAVSYQSVEFALMFCSDFFTPTMNNLQFVKALYDIVLKKG